MAGPMRCQSALSSPLPSRQPRAIPSPVWHPFTPSLPPAWRNPGYCRAQPQHIQTQTASRWHEALMENPASQLSLSLSPFAARLTGKRGRVPGLERAGAAYRHWVVVPGQPDKGGSLSLHTHIHTQPQLAGVQLAGTHTHALSFTHSLSKPAFHNSSTPTMTAVTPPGSRAGWRW